MDELPNPGSDAALDLGCCCPVLDNNHGRWAPWPPHGWWIHPECKLHGIPSLENLPLSMKGDGTNE